MAGGGKLANNQTTFLIFEGPMVMIAGLVLGNISSWSLSFGCLESDGG
jgi:hypothetical protein